MKLKDKKIELLRQVHTRDEMGFTKTTLESMGDGVGAFSPPVRQRSVCGSNSQLQGRSAVSGKLPH